MASKGQKFKKHNSDIKEIILDRYLKGESSISLGKEFEISQNTIQTWGKKIKYPEKYFKFGKRGRPKEKVLTREDYKERYEILKKYQAFLKAQRERK
jgi:hypothetical protein